MWRIVGVSAIAALLLATGCGSSERVGSEGGGQAHALTMASPWGGSDDTIFYFAGLVHRLSHGELRVRVVDSGHGHEPDYEAATIRDLQHGRADLSWAGARIWDVFGARRLRALQAPLLIDSYDLEQRVLQSDLVGPMLAELKPLGLIGLGIIPGDMRHPFSFSRRLGGPTDYKGLRIGTQESRVADATMRVLGAQPVRVPADIVGLRGVDGLEQRAYTIQGDRLGRPGSHFAANVNLWPRPLVLYASAKAWNRLTRTDRDVLREAAADALAPASNGVRNMDAETAGDLCRQGNVSFDLATPTELSALRTAVAPVYRELERDRETRAVIQRIQALKTQLDQPASALPRCPGRVAVPAAARSPLDGVWQMDTTDANSHAQGTAENWGHWIFAFRQGRFAITQENADSCTWGYGTFTVHGTRTTWKFTDGGGIAPNNAMNKPGEFFGFTLSAYRDTLKLTPLRGYISPENFRAKPWRQLSTTPSRAYFSKRCPPPADALSG